MKYQALILDLDGTIVESIPGIENSANSAFKKHGFPVRSRDEIRSFIGNGSWDFFKKALPEEPDSVIKEVETCFKSLYQDLWKQGTEVFEGITPFLEKCHSAGIKLTILSNKPHPFTTEIVNNLFKNIDFSLVLGQQEGIPKKPEPNGVFHILEKLSLQAKDVLFIGDSEVDIATAHNAKMDCLAVTWGYEELENITALKPKYLINTVAELSTTLDL